MKRGRVIGCFLLIVLLAIGCTGTTSQNAVPLIFQYNDGDQVSYVNALWSPEKGTMEIGKEPILSYSASLPIIAAHWESSGKASLFTSEDISTTSQVQTNGVDINVISLANSLPSYYEPVVAYTTTQAIYAKGVGEQGTTISKITASAMQQYQVNNGQYLGMGAIGNKTYVVVGSQEAYTGKGPHTMTMSVILDTINPDGSIVAKTVRTGYNASLLTQYYATPDANIPFANGNFYFARYKIDVTAQEPKMVETTTLTKSFEMISTASSSLEPYSFGDYFPTFSKYKDYLVAVGMLNSSNGLTVAAFKDDNLVGFSLITPYTMVRPIPESSKQTRIYTYNAQVKQVRNYPIETPLKVIVPDSP
ncbi:hypothetical protein [Coprothermobacter platensis]|uniref:hypothetical protein n=1 Tax=Coprothermobacter platensis TaxID=108819 RepID=UPI00036D76E0|nr:hypothetical protein [Coprothermobacter platensis]